MCWKMFHESRSTSHGQILLAPSIVGVWGRRIFPRGAEDGMKGHEQDVIHITVCCEWRVGRIVALLPNYFR